MLKDLKLKYKDVTIFEKIIGINVIIFFVGVLLLLVKGNNLMSYFKLPTDVMDFMFQPWSIITYGFLHSNGFHLFINLLILYVLSRFLLNILRTKTVLNIYFLGIIIGGLAFLLIYNIFPKVTFKNTAPLVGASAGIRALIIFICAYMPNTELRTLAFKVKWKYIGFFIVIIDVLGVFGDNVGGHISHLGGALLGYFYAVKLQQGNDIGLGFERIMDTVVSWFKPKPALKTVHRKRKKETLAGKTKEEFYTFNKQKKIDLILEKISKSGYESLTAEEKEFLFRAGK